MSRPLLQSLMGCLIFVTLLALISPLARARHSHQAKASQDPQVSQSDEPKTNEPPLVRFETLLEDLLDRDHLARWPNPPYRCAQASSYDRASVSPQEPGWFANMDRSHFVRVEETDQRKEYVMMDAQGPGAIVRVWATWHGAKDAAFSNGTLRVYLDGSEDPAIEGPIASIIGGEALVGPPLSRHAALDCPENTRAHNLFLPIPYQRQCKVTYETDAPIDPGAHQGEALYYQINYRTYPSDTTVETYSESIQAQHSMQLEKTRRVLGADQRPSPMRFKERKYSGRLGKNASAILKETGTHAIRRLEIQLSSEGDLEQAMRSTVLEMYFDGHPTVFCPLDHFFGSGPRIRAFNSWVTEVRNNRRLISYWVMPFRKQGVIRIRNLGQETVKANLKVFFDSWDWDEDSMHFHADWNPSIFLETRRGKQGYFDANYGTLNGTGVLVGDTLSVFNGAAAWWGEGDEKIYVDGEEFPSHFGTGTEDYYGYAWCRPEFFSAPFHNQPTGAGNMAPGFSINSRYRVLDAIPFENSLKFDMELWHWADTKVHFMPTLFWYAKPGATDNVEPRTDIASLALARKRSDVVEIFTREGALEGEDMEIQGTPAGIVESQEIHGLGWSGDTQVWWRDAMPGDQLILKFPVNSTGQYRVFANLTKANDYGQVEVQIDNQDPVIFDRYHQEVAFDEFQLGSFLMDEGTHLLKITLRGSNELAIPRHMFGLDYLRLEPIED